MGVVWERPTVVEGAQPPLSTAASSNRELRAVRLEDVRTPEQGQVEAAASGNRGLHDDLTGAPHVKATTASSSVWSDDSKDLNLGEADDVGSEMHGAITSGKLGDDANLRRDVAPRPADEVDGDDGDHIFRAAVFDQAYRFHISLYVACILLVVSFISLIPTECLQYSSPVPYMAAGLLVLLVTCAVTRWFKNNSRQYLLDLALEEASTRPLLIAPARFNSYAMLATFTIFSVGIINVGLTTADHRDFCSGTDLFDGLMPAWLSHIGSIEFLLGIILSTHMVSLRRVIVRSCLVHLSFLVELHFVMSSGRTLSYALGCHVIQHVAFGLGVYVGHTLVIGQRYYFDQVPPRLSPAVDQRLAAPCLPPPTACRLPELLPGCFLTAPPLPRVSHVLSGDHASHIAAQIAR